MVKTYYTMRKYQSGFNNQNFTQDTSIMSILLLYLFLKKVYIIILHEY